MPRVFGTILSLRPAFPMNGQKHLSRWPARSKLQALFSHPDIHLQTPEHLATWRDVLRVTIESVRFTIGHLRGRAPRTMEAAQDIEKAIFPVYANLDEVISRCTHPLPCNLNPDEQARPAREWLKEHSTFDWISLLEALAEAVVAECGTKLGFLAADQPGNEMVKQKVPNGKSELGGMFSHDQNFEASKPIRKSTSSFASDQKYLEWIAEVHGPSAVKLQNMARDTSKTIEERMQQIYAIHKESLGWNSGKWAKILGVKDGSVRQGKWWRETRRVLMRDP